MKKFLFLFIFSILNASECENLNDCIQKAKFYHYDKENSQKASVYYKLACEKYQHYQACKSLSDIYKYSKNKNISLSEKYKNKTIKLSQEQCKNQNPKACYDYANFCEIDYAKCDDFDKYYKISAELYEKECNKQNYNSCYQLALMYFDGLGVNASETKALDLHKIACFNKNAKSCYEIAKFYENKYNEFSKKSCEYGLEDLCKKP